MRAITANQRLLLSKSRVSTYFLVKLVTWNFPLHTAEYTVGSVDATYDTIYWGNTAALAAGTAVEYTKSGGVASIGLTEGTTYYVGVYNAYRFTLHPTYAEAIAGTGKINLTASGTEIHRLQKVIRNTTTADDVSIATMGLFAAEGGLLSVEAPRLSKVVDRETYKIAYIDPAFEKRALFEAGLTGSDITVYLGFYNNLTADEPVGGVVYAGGVLHSGGLNVNPGEKLLGAEDLIIVYAGTVDTQGYSVNPDDGTVIVAIEGSSPMAALGLTKAFITSKDSMLQVNATDTAFDQVFVGSKKVAYLWGKE